jgi:hypothetical protein
MKKSVANSDDRHQGPDSKNRSEKRQLVANKDDCHRNSFVLPSGVFAMMSADSTRYSV